MAAWQRTDADQPLRGVCARKILIALEHRASGQRSAPRAGQSVEQRPGRSVVVRHRGNEMRNTFSGRSIQQRIDHARGEALAARRLGDRNLPDKEAVGLCRRAIAGDPTQDLPAPLDNDARVREMSALQEVAISGIAVERCAVCDQTGDRRTIRGPRPSQLERFPRPRNNSEGRMRGSIRSLDPTARNCFCTRTNCFSLRIKMKPIP